MVPTVADATIAARMSPTPDQPSPPRSPLASLLGAGARGAERVAAATGIDEAVERTTEEAIVRALESPAVERAIVRVLESQAAQDALERTLSSPAMERAAVKVLDSELVDEVWEHLLASDEAQRLVERIAEAPEVRAAIAAQGVGLISDLGRQVRRVTQQLDDGLERLVRRLLRKPARAEPTQHVGFVTRALALALDAAILNGIFVLSIAALKAILGGADEGLSAAGAALSAFGWIVAGSAYLLTFWSLAGQTPGQRFLSIRIEDYDGSRRLGLRRAWRRLVGGALAAIPLGLGFVGVLTRDDRRGWHDRRAGTDVVVVDPELAPWTKGAQAGDE
jgi:uncharacterized RDD family membrane protein YckC